MQATSAEAFLAPLPLSQAEARAEWAAAAQPQMALDLWHAHQAERRRGVA